MAVFAYGSFQRKGENMRKITTTRRTFVGASALTGAALLAACGNNQDTATEATTTDETAAEDTAASDAGIIGGTYSVYVKGYDWGCGVETAILTLDEPVEGLTADNLLVSETKQVTDFTDETFPVIEGTFDRTVLEVTPLSSADSDEAASGPTAIYAVKLQCTPEEGSPLLYTMSTGYNTWSDPYVMNFVSSDDAPVHVAVAGEPTDIASDADLFTMDSFTSSDNIEIKYAYLPPAEASENLVVWLHGAGEGGTDHTDPRITLLGNKVTALGSDEFQETVGGAHILVPQSPTMWMDIDGTSTYIDTENSTEVRSHYTQAVEELIDSCAEKIGAKKILLCGCSNGGFMTLWLTIHRPDAYVGAVPICEAVPDALITDEQIASLKDVPLYFVYSKDDPIVIPDQHEIPTIERLRAAGKGDDTLHVSTTDTVVDTSGEVKDAEGKPYQYNGHWSWIYFDNNDCECDIDGLKAWDFIKECFA